MAALNLLLRLLPSSGQKEVLLSCPGQLCALVPIRGALAVELQVLIVPSILLHLEPLLDFSCLLDEFSHPLAVGELASLHLLAALL